MGLDMCSEVSNPSSEVVVAVELINVKEEMERGKISDEVRKLLSPFYPEIEGLSDLCRLQLNTMARMAVSSIILIHV